MLDATTKRNIDAARDVLVGKVPDPKAQVEQITTALIYKFMDDLDKESVRLGGKAKFFSGEYEKYSWSNLVDTRLSGEARLGLYVQAITSMDKNPNLPQLFRDIFKGAFLPYNDPQTLSLFLKEINKFNYDHSEELGNAFEYLLSIMSSQGAAGQFRTPRHIIDFMVAVVDPQKNETILDPACGTAGFLISSYKHIRKHNSSNFDVNNGIGGGMAESADQAFLQDDPLYRGDLLTQDERRRLMENIQGYDISPDMVRLSLVNLYLHGFPSPNVFEYDTLSSEDHWNDSFDVILANPPFMTPKGGIRPHKRFQVQAKRSEVLFVDYILEHLNVNGRAGIIVPEGIIFKSENAYKKLRKLLVEDGLYAVVSLPSGVFQPYSGVKTSILFFDHQFAKEVDEILFAKIENDGFDLGAQRNSVESNDLPLILGILKKWKKYKKQESTKTIWVQKNKILKSNDFVLMFERYQDNQIKSFNDKWPLIKLGKLLTLEYGRPLKSSNRVIGEYPVFGSNGIVGSHNEYLVEGPFLVVGRKGSAGAVTFSEKNGFPIDTTFYVKIIDKEKLNLKFLFYLLRKLNLENLIIQSGVPGLNRNDVYKIEIPLPPLEVQKEIVEQIEVKQAAIDAAKSVIENLEKERRYFGHELDKVAGVEWVDLGSISERITKGTTPTTIGNKFEEEGINFIKIESIAEDGRILKDKLSYISEDCNLVLKRSQLRKNDILFSIAGAFGRVAIVPDSLLPANTNQALAIISLKKEINSQYVYNYLKSANIFNEILKLKVGVAQYNISLRQVSKLKIPLPKPITQQKMVEEANVEDAIVASNRELIKMFESRISKILVEI